MEFNDYQEQIAAFDLFAAGSSDRVDMALVDKVLGLAGEAGEVADKVKKALRDDGGRLSPVSRDALGLELGDLLWYLATTARYLGLPLDEVAMGNLKKLSRRAQRGTLGGSGDLR